MRWRRIPTLVIIITNDVNVRTVLLLLPPTEWRGRGKLAPKEQTSHILFKTRPEYNLIPQQHGGSTHLPLFVLSWLGWPQERSFFSSSASIICSSSHASKLLLLSPRTNCSCSPFSMIWHDRLPQYLLRPFLAFICNLKWLRVSLYSCCR